MKTLAAFDPGVAGFGVAIFVDDLLLVARYIKNPLHDRGGLVAWRGAGLAAANHAIKFAADAVICEFPRVYGDAQSKGDRNDLIALTCAASFALAPFGVAEIVYPQQWKGQLPKAICQRRIVAALTAVERERVALPVASLAHNVWDAVGIGLFAIGRGVR